jgi:O-acetylhomoserine/O-acetylserine sulfhydrylase-like pyridoxal-dependent enzyme
VYGGTFELLGSNLPSLGIATTFLLGSEVDRLADAIISCGLEDAEDLWADLEGALGVS